MLEKSVLQKCWGIKSWRGVLQRSVVEKCCREVLEKSVLQKCWGIKSWRGVLQRSVVEKCCREVL